MTEKSKKPRLRFKGFTEAWEQCELTKLGRIETGNTPSTAIEDYYSDTGLLWVTPTDIISNIIVNTDKKLTTKGIAVARVIPANSILCTCIASIGKNAFLPVKCAFNQQINALTPFENNDPYFLFTNSYHWSQTMKKGAGGLTFQIVNKTEFSNIKTHVPEYVEQKKIGQLFYKLDNLITLHQRKYDKFVAIKKALLEKMFPRAGKSVPEIRFKGFTETWEQCKLGDSVEVCSGKDYKHLRSGDIPVYGTGGYMLSVNEALSYNQDAIGIGRKGTIDKPYVLNAPFWTVDTLFYAILKKNNDLSFMFSIFQKVDWKSKDESTGVPSLSKNTINDVDIIIPILEEQSKIGSIFSSIDNLITLHQRQLEKLKNIKSALLEKMFV